MLEEILSFAGFCSICHAVANGLRALLAYRESEGKNSILDKFIEYATYPFFLFGLPAFLAIGSSHEYILKLSINNVLEKHDRDIRKMQKFARQSFRAPYQMQEEPYFHFNYDEREAEIIDSLEIKPWKWG